MEITEKTIDLEKAIRNGNNRFLKSLPAFAIKLLRRLFCENEMNYAIYRSRHLEGVPFVKDVLEGWGIKINIKGEDNIPSGGRFIFVSNHPLGAIDAMGFFVVISRHFPEVVSPANQLLNHIPNMRSLILGLDVFGRTSRETAKKLDELFASEKQVMIFPAGEVSRKRRGKISDIEWQKSFITKAVQHKRDIIPVHISGRNSNLFYNVANIRKFLGIKMYIETILLPREMIGRRNSEVTYTIGKPVIWKSLTDGKAPLEWAQEIKRIVYSLPSYYA